MPKKNNPLDFIHVFQIEIIRIPSYTFWLPKHLTLDPRIVDYETEPPSHQLVMFSDFNEAFAIPSL